MVVLLSLCLPIVANCVIGAFLSKTDMTLIGDNYNGHALSHPLTRPFVSHKV